MGVAQCCWRGDGNGLSGWTSASNTEFCCTKIKPDGVPGSDERAARLADVAAAALLVVHAKGIITLLDLGVLDDLASKLGILDPVILALPLLPLAGGNDDSPLSPPVAASILTLMGCSPSRCDTAELLPSIGWLASGLAEADASPPLPSRWLVLGT